MLFNLPDINVEVNFFFFFLLLKFSTSDLTREINFAIMGPALDWFITLYTTIVNAIKNRLSTVFYCIKMNKIHQKMILCNRVAVYIQRTTFIKYKYVNITRNDLYTIVKPRYPDSVIEMDFFFFF